MTKRIIKKSLFTCIVACLAFVAASIGLIVNSSVASATEKTETVNYTADFSSGIPGDWSLYGRTAMETNVVDSTPTDNKLTIGNTNAFPGADHYFGSVYRVAQSLGKVSDFTLEMKYTVSSWVNDSRWLALMYRTATTWRGEITGYGMSYRVNGNSYEIASSYPTTEGIAQFNDGANVNTGVTMVANSSTEYTLKVVVSGANVEHYLNNTLVESFSLAENAAGNALDGNGVNVFNRLGGYHSNGGFAIVTSGMTINIISFKITNAVRLESTDGYVAKFDSASIDSTTKMPQGWKIDPLADVGGTSVSHDANSKMVTVVADQASPNAIENNYYGSKIDLNVGNYTDFTFEMKFEMTSSLNPNRWIGVMYHTQVNPETGRTTGYMQNYRQNSRTASSIITATATSVKFSDFNEIAASTTDNLDDLNVGETHTLRIWVEGDVVYNYMDDWAISSFKLTDKQGDLGAIYFNGGFSIIVNCSTINIKGITISGTRTPDEDGYQKKSDYTDLPFSPTVVLDVDSQEDLAVAASYNTESAIYTIDGELNVLGQNGTAITTLENALSVTSGYALPIIRVDGEKNNTLNKDDFSFANAATLGGYLPSATKTKADALLGYLQSSGLTDVSIMSNDAVLLAYIRRSNPSVRGILDWSSHNLTEANWQYVIATTNTAWAHVAVLNEVSATRAAVEHLQGRLKTVWIQQERFSQFNTASLVSTGCYGIITDEPKGVLDTYTIYAADLNSLVRAPMNIAHRGIAPVAENTLEGYQAAYESGAIYFEIDTWLTADNRVVLLHNAWMDDYTTGTGDIRTLNYTGYVENQYVDVSVDGTKLTGDARKKVPLVTELFKYFRDKDIVYAFEIKDGNPQIVYKIRELMEAHHAAYKDEPNYVNIWDQMFFITFQTSQNPSNPGPILETLRDVIPEIPTAYLNDTTNEICSQLNCVEDVAGGSRAHTEFVKKRGYMSYCWTYHADNTDDAYVPFGSYGITTNYAHTLTENARFLDPISSGAYVNGPNAFANGYKMNFVSENRVTPVLTQTTASVHALEESADEKSFSAIFKAQAVTKTESIPYTLYSEAIDFYKLSVGYDSNYVRVNGSPLNTYYQEGTQVSLNLSSVGENCKIKSVSINGNSTPVDDTEMTLSFKMDEVKDISIEYEKKYSVSVQEENGRLTINSPSKDGYYVKGTVLTVRPAAATGYRIRAVKLNGANAVLEPDGTLVFEVSSDTVISLETVKTYDLTVENGANGSFSGVENKAYDQGETLTIAVMPNDGYRVSLFEINGYAVDLNENGQYVFVMNLDLNIRIQYERIPEGSSSSNENGGGGCFSTSSTSFVALTLGVVACAYVVISKKRKQN